MNFKKILCAMTMTVLSVSIVVFLCGNAVSAADELNINVEFAGEYVGYSDYDGYKVHDGLVSPGSGSISDITDSSVVGKTSATCIIPGKSSEPIAVKHSSLSDAGIPLKDIKYVRYNYYYAGSTDIADRAELVVKASEFNLTKERKAYAMETVVNDGWVYLTFDFGEFVNDYALDGGTLPEMVFYPFGRMSASELSSEDKLYIYELAIWSENCVNAIAARDDKSLVETYPVYFVSGRPDAVGEDPDTVYVEKGGKVVLPENPYTLEGYRFNGWVSSDGNTLYNAGDEVAVRHKQITGSRTTSRTYFVANWTLTKKTGLLPDIKVVPFSDYNQGTNGVVDQSKGGMYAKRTLNVEYDGIPVTKFEFLPEAEGAGRTIVFDGWEWNNMPLDISHYKYCAFVYYWDTTSTRSYTPKISLLGSPSDVGKALTESRVFSGKQSLQKNKWAVCGFDIDFVNDSTNKQYVRWDTNTVVNQVHFYPFGSPPGTGNYAKAMYMPETDALYIGNFIFFKDKPKANPTFNHGYITGFEDGTFKPHEALTNAQSAVLLARVLGVSEETLASQTTSLYSDVEKGEWYFGAVAYLESVGILTPEKGDKFYPDEPTSRNSFVNMLLGELSGGDTGAETVNAKKIPASTETGALTRAEAVVNINAILKGLVSTTVTGSAFSASPFVDVDSAQWFYPDLVFAATRAVLYTDSNGNTGIADTPEIPPEQEAAKDIPDELFEEGAEYVSALDITTDRRIDEIRSTESEYTVKPGGKIYYVSTTEGYTSNPGTDKNAPKLITDLSEVGKISAQPGDVILFKRGDIFRGDTMYARPGVTYSAYGEGEKPLLTRSPADIANRNKWILVEGTDNIWMYTDRDLVDVGAINLVKSNGDILVAYKEIPNYKNGMFIVRGTDSTEYDFKTELDCNYMYFHDAQYTKNAAGEYEKVGATANGVVGPLYLRCDEGNPGAVFDEIYFNLKNNVIRCENANGVTIDNLCIKYFGSHGVGAGTIHNLTVRNCEIGWGGGSIQHYKDGVVTRFGNGIEIYGGLANYTIDNCYVYQIYDAGITHQISSDDRNCHMEGVYYTNNVLTHSTYNIEYFMSNSTVTGNERMMKDVYFTDNIVRMAGYGWGVQRPDSAPSNIKGWAHNNFCDNYVIENNIFDRCINLRTGEDYCIQVGTSFDNSTPYLKNNIFVQTPGRTLMYYGHGTYTTLIDSEEMVLNGIAGDGNKLYFYEDDTELYKGNVYWES